MLLIFLKGTKRLDKYKYSDFEIIDAHSHIFPKKIAQKAAVAIGDFYDIPMFSEGSSELLLQSGREIGVKKYLVCSTATVPQQTESINTFIKDECNEHPEFFGFGTLHPNMEQLDVEVERIISLGLHGIKIHPDFQKFNIDDKEAYKIYEAIEGRLPILIHMGDNRYEYSKPYRLAKVLDDFQKLEVLAAHFGGYQCWTEAEECLKRPNIKFDTSSSLPMIEPEYARKLINYYGVENMFFGSDFPMWRHTDELERFFQIGLSYEDNKKILSGNFNEYFGLKG